jgi:hypothetical protein
VNIWKSRQGLPYSQICRGQSQYTYGAASNFSPFGEWLQKDYNQRGNDTHSTADGLHNKILALCMYDMGGIQYQPLVLNPPASSSRSIATTKHDVGIIMTQYKRALTTSNCPRGEKAAGANILYSLWFLLSLSNIPTPLDTAVNNVTNGRSKVPIRQNYVRVAVTIGVTNNWDCSMGFWRSLGRSLQRITVTAVRPPNPTGDTDGYGKNGGKTGRNTIVTRVAIKWCEHNKHHTNSGWANAF